MIWAAYYIYLLWFLLLHYFKYFSKTPNSHRNVLLFAFQAFLKLSFDTNEGSLSCFSCYFHAFYKNNYWWSPFQAFISFISKTLAQNFLAISLPTSYFDSHFHRVILLFLIFSRFTFIIIFIFQRCLMIDIYLWKVGFYFLITYFSLRLPSHRDDDIMLIILLFSLPLWNIIYFYIGNFSYLNFFTLIHIFRYAIPT